MPITVVQQRTHYIEYGMVCCSVARTQKARLILIMVLVEFQFAFVGKTSMLSSPIWDQDQQKHTRSNERITTETMNHQTVAGLHEKNRE